MSKKLPFSNPKISQQNSGEIHSQNNIEEMRDKLYRLQYVTTALSKEPSIKEIANIIVSLTAASLSANGGTIWVYSPSGELEITAQIGYTEEQIGMWKKIVDNDDTPTGDAIRLKKTIIVHSRAEREKLYPQTVSFSESTASESFIAIPLLSGKEVLGAVGFSFKVKKEFIAEELEYVYTLMQQCAQAIQKAIYYEEDKLQKKELKIAIDRLEALQDVTKHLSRAKTPEETTQVIVTKSAKVLGAKGAEVVLLSEDEKSFRIPTYYGFPAWYMKPITNSYMPLDYKAKLFILEVSKSGQPIFISGWNEVPKDYNHFFEVMKIIDCQAAAYIPLKINNKVIGVMDFSFSEEKIFDKQEKDFMITLAENCAQAMDRAFGYQKIKDYADKIEKKEAWFRSLIENSADVISLIDKKGIIRYVSNSVERISGVLVKDRIGKNILTTVYPPDRHLFNETLSVLRNSPLGAVKAMQFRRIKSDGSLQWIEATASNLLADPIINAIVLNSRDVTEQIEAEESLKKSQGELQTILENIVDAVMVYDENGKILYANASAVKLNRYKSIKDLMENTSLKNYMRKFTHISDDAGNPLDHSDLWETKQGKEVMTKIRKYVFKDGVEQWRKVTTAPILDTNGKIQLAISISQDITNEREKERLKDEFISTASHELKTPITSASLYAGILQKHLQEVRDEKGYATLGKVDGQLKRLTKLINDLLDVSRINTGGVHMKKEEVMIDDLIAEVVEEMQYTTINHKLVIHGESRRKIFVDKERIREVLVNLISNAIKYSPMSKKVEILVENKKKEVKICIKDYGVGIRAENQEKIFEPFYRESHKSGARFPGLGLGLHISSKIIKMHGGKLWVDSIYGKGSKFCILLPMSEI
ncbi:MAG TPA: PAS domain S-box protein [Candidatus Saccharimonadales bacterium]|nr:PAS domain S-box protein [Candidatus Saccharimonadales bacterium]